MTLGYGVSQIVDGRPGRGLELVEATAQSLEELGFESFWVADHVVFFDRVDDPYPHSSDGSFGFLPDQGLLEPLMVLQAAARVTTRLRVGTSVEIVTERHPLVRARQIATLDHFSAGRFDYGVGLGWVKAEYRALGIPWERRAARADEHIRALKAIWTERRTSFHGEFVDFDDAIMFPKPVQQPHPPIIVGGNSPGALRRAARLGDGWYGWNLSIDELDRCLTGLAEELAAVGRSMDDGFRVQAGVALTGEPTEIADYVERARRRPLHHLSFGWALSSRRYRRQLESLAQVLRLGQR